MFTASLDQEFDGGGNLHDIVAPKHPGGKKPLPLTSSWTMNERLPVPPRPTVIKYFIDERGGDTVAKTATIWQAM